MPAPLESAGSGLSDCTELHWLQKLSIAVANQTAIGALRRTTVCTRQRVLGGVGESGDGDYESVVLERAVM